MKLAGSAEFPYPPAAVWTALHDVDMLAKAIPGCQSITAAGDDEYVVAVALGVAAIKGDYAGTIRVEDVEFPRHYVLAGAGAGTPGYINVKVDIYLEPAADGTTLQWVCDAEVGGVIAGIGGRVLTGISKYLAKQFFKDVNDEMKAACVDQSNTAVGGR